MCGIQHDVLSNRDSYVTNEAKVPAERYAT
jgi:hypothetical protein